jgi:hypothetical protein
MAPRVARRTGRFSRAALALFGALSFAPRVSADNVESLDSSVCRLIAAAARNHALPEAFLTGLIWQESSFRSHVVSPAGAQGIAQFMPRTAGERGLPDPFDPEQAIPKAAEFLAALQQRFGNLGLAAAAYNAGASRVARWLAHEGGLPFETQNYVLAITGHEAEDWMKGAEAAGIAEKELNSLSCLEKVAAIRRSSPRLIAVSPLLAPWGVQLAGNFSKARALAAYARAQSHYPGILRDVEPMIIGGRLRSRGFSPFYRVRAPAPSRAAAEALCARIRNAGGACGVLRS